MRVVVTVPEEQAGERLDRFVASLPEVGSRGAAERLLGEGRVLVDGAARPKSQRLTGAEEIAVDLPEQESFAPGELQPVSVAYEDEHLLVVDKPAGIAVHPGAGPRTGTLADALAAHGATGGDPERPGIVHRLDRDTSGLLVVARSIEAYDALSHLVRERALTREYRALVRGRPRSRRGTIDSPIGRDRRDPVRRSLDTDAPKEAVTHFEVVELLPQHALLRVRLETGRTHQIRVHLAAIDLPVSGDPTYGVRRDLGLRRQFLHAARLAFVHPVTGEEIDVSSPLPADLSAALEQAR